MLPLTAFAEDVNNTETSDLSNEQNLQVVENLLTKEQNTKNI